MKMVINARHGCRWLAGCCLLGIVTAANAQSSSPPASARRVLAAPPSASLRHVVHASADSFGRRVLSFEANQGQSISGARYLAHGQGYSLSLRPAEAEFALRKPAALHKDGRSARVKMDLIGSDPGAHFAAARPLACQVNYFHGNDPSRWRTHIPTFSRVRSQGVYPGIDMVYYGTQKQLEYDFVVAPRADLTAIRIGFDGARKTRIAPDGSLRVDTAAGELRWKQPLVYQESHGRRHMVAARFTASGGKRPSIGFAVAAYDHSRPLVIDPTLIFSTYLGGAGVGNEGKEEGHAITADASDNVYVTGYSSSPDFPAPHSGSPDAFIAKFAPDGTLLYLTYLGGDGQEIGGAIAVDASGNAVVAGFTNSFNFPVSANAFQAARPTPLYPTSSGFLAKLAPDGASLLYSTYICDTLTNYTTTSADAVALDSAGAAYVTGTTGALALPVRHYVQNHLVSTSTMYVAKYNMDAVVADDTLVYATYLGGTGYGGGHGIAVDSSGSAYIVGYGSTDFLCTTNAIPLSAGGNGSIVILKMNPAGDGILYSTRFGGGNEYGAGIALDASGSVYIGGYTLSPDFPHTAGAYQTSLRGYSDGFVTKMNITAAGATIVYSTFIGAGGEYTAGLGVDGAGCAWIAGSTYSTDFPVVSPVQGTNLSRPTADHYISTTYLSRLSPDGSELIFSTYLGGSGFDIGLGFALDRNHNALITGTTLSTDFPLRHATQSVLRGATDIIVAKVQAQIADLELTQTVAPGSVPSGGRVALASEIINHGPDDATNVDFEQTLTRAYDPDAPFDTVAVSAIISGHRSDVIIPTFDNHHLSALIPLVPANDRVLVQLFVTTSRPIADGTITSAVTETSDASDPNPSNNHPSPITVAVTLPVAPHITTLSPDSAPTGGAPFDLTVSGSNFRAGSTVTWNGTARATTFVSATQLTAQIDAADIAAAGSAAVTVTDPGGAISNAVPFFIGAPVLRASLFGITRSALGYHVVVQVRNVGTSAASSVNVLSATLGGVSPLVTPLPGLGTIAPSASGFATIDFPLSAGASGATVILTFRAGYSAGVLNSARRVRLP